MQLKKLKKYKVEPNQEISIKRQVCETNKKWQELNIVVSLNRDNKDKFILGTAEDIIAALDDH